MSETTEEKSQIQVRFITQQREYTVTDSAILVPTNLRRYGLSEIINHLLGFEKPIPFDFIINNQFLRTSLSEYLIKHEISTENIITIEYVESMLPPTPLSSFQHDDWISSVKGHNQSLFLTGSYDNNVRVFNTSGECLQTLVGHLAPIKSVSWVTVSDDSIVCLSSSQDRTIRAWQASLVDKNYKTLYECKGHTGSVESVSVHPSCTEFASASWDSSILLWSMDMPEEIEYDILAIPSKKRRLNNSEIKIKKPITTMHGHVGPVSSVIFDTKNHNKLYSGGWDHSLRIWDIEARTNVDTKNCDKSVLDIAYSDKSGLIASGHSDHIVRLWDPRSEAVVKLAFASHKNWISCISWSPNSQFMLVSGSYDASIKIWDIRSKTPLYTLNPGGKENLDNKKILCIDWDLDIILSGGEDNKLYLHGSKTIT
ncbi:18261_t:CDS:10 [Acaulospora morrowiae]|uniref:Ribosome biogenesis protein YTM1 n=1 Tax=Acaulospora morrowiae TaxID=94023 RepID=A0A9N9F1E3_9GLOM|nr:18261_t:CDS:10 [Acaulospora morrowiae]